MTEPATSTPKGDPHTTNPDRPPLYRVYAGSMLKGRTVRILGMDDQIPARAKALVEEVKLAITSQVDPENPKQATVRYTNLERIFRTSEEKELGRDFTHEQATIHQRAWEARHARITEQHTRGAIAYGIEEIAKGLERVAADLRQELASELSDPAEKVSRTQHALAWLFPNLHADNLTRRAIEWTTASRDVQRLLTEGIEPA